MATIETFSARDLRNRSGELLREAEEGGLSLITKHGRPTAIAVADASPLIGLAAASSLGLLRELFGEIVVPKAVEGE